MNAKSNPIIICANEESNHTRNAHVVALTHNTKYKAPKRVICSFYFLILCEQSCKFAYIEDNHS